MTPHVPLPFGDHIVVAIFALFVGGAAALVFTLAAPRLKARLRHSALIGGAIVAACTFAIAVRTRATDHLFGGYFSFKTPRERLQDHFADFDAKVSRDPEIRRALEGIPDPGLKLKLLRTRGVARLDDVTLRRRARLWGILLPLLSDRACACLFQHTTSTESDLAEIDQAMLKLESGFVAEWMQVIYVAMLAEVRQSPVRAPSNEEAAAAYRALEEKIGVDAAKRLSDGLGKEAPEPEFARAVREFYKVAPTLSEPHATVLLRMMQGP